MPMKYVPMKIYCHCCACLALMLHGGSHLMFLQSGKGWYLLISPPTEDLWLPAHAVLGLSGFFRSSSEDAFGDGVGGKEVVHHGGNSSSHGNCHWGLSELSFHYWTRQSRHSWFSKGYSTCPCNSSAIFPAEIHRDEPLPLIASNRRQVLPCNACLSWTSIVLGNHSGIVLALI